MNTIPTIITRLIRANKKVYIELANSEVDQIFVITGINKNGKGFNVVSTKGLEVIKSLNDNGFESEVFISNSLNVDGFESEVFISNRQINGRYKNVEARVTFDIIIWIENEEDIFNCILSDKTSTNVIMSYDEVVRAVNTMFRGISWVDIECCWSWIINKIGVENEDTLREVMNDMRKFEEEASNLYDIDDD